MSHPKLDTLLLNHAEERPCFPFEADLHGRIVGDDAPTTGPVTVYAVLDRTAVIAQGDDFRLVRRSDLSINPTSVHWRPVGPADRATLAERKQAWVSRHQAEHRSPAA